MNAELVLAAAGVGVGTAERLGLGPIDDDDLTAAHAEAVLAEYLQSPRQCFRLHSDPSRELPLGDRDLRDCPGRAGVVKPQQESRETL